VARRIVRKKKRKKFAISQQQHGSVEELLKTNRNHTKKSETIIHVHKKLARSYNSLVLTTLWWAFFRRFRSPSVWCNVYGTIHGTVVSRVIARRKRTDWTRNGGGVSPCGAAIVSASLSGQRKNVNEQKSAGQISRETNRPRPDRKKTETDALHIYIILPCISRVVPFVRNDGTVSRRAATRTHHTARTLQQRDDDKTYATVVF